MKRYLSWVIWLWRVLKALFVGLGHVGFVILRTLNLWEPDTLDHNGVYRPMLSISKLAMWFSLGLVCYVFTSDQGLAAEILSGLTMATATGNYGYRRHVQARTGTAGFRNRDLPDDGGEMEFEEEPLGGIVDPDAP